MMHTPFISGYYCNSDGLDAPTGTCGAGYYCPAGQKERRPSAYQCTPGHYCTAGSPEEIACPSGEYQDLFGQVCSHDYDR